jgi:hypothetical protein
MMKGYAVKSRTKKCEYLSGEYVLACKANKVLYVPSSFEMEEYCKSIRHVVCPFYMKVEAFADKSP